MRTLSHYIDHFRPDTRIIFIIMASVCSFFMAACLRTDGNLTLKGHITDQVTKESIPNRKVIIHARVSRENRFVPVYAGMFISDSTGCFSCTLTRVKNAYDYDFALVGDTDYLFKTERIPLFGLTKNGEFLSFSMQRLTPLKIRINRECRNPSADTLYLYWESDGSNGRGLASYKVFNFGNEGNPLGSSNNPELRWIGGNIKSLVTTRVYADKKTVIYFELIRNGRRRVITDTITCRRNAENDVYFKY